MYNDALQTAGNHLLSTQTGNLTPYPFSIVLSCGSEDTNVLGRYLGRLYPGKGFEKLPDVLGAGTSFCYANGLFIIAAPFKAFPPVGWFSSGNGEALMATLAGVAGDIALAILHPSGASAIAKGVVYKILCILESVHGVSLAYIPERLETPLVAYRDVLPDLFQVMNQLGSPQAVLDALHTQLRAQLNQTVVLGSDHPAGWVSTTFYQGAGV